jgi:pyruvyltransferase
MARFAHTLVHWAPAKEADLVCVGSILEALTPSWKGLIVGSGKLRETSVINVPKATILALRGPLTAKGIPGDYALGDPALLANELVTVDKQYNLGIVPHWSDTTLETRFQSFDPHIIRPSGDPCEVLREIGRCRKIVASSLHGIIVADAFGIPRRIEMTPLFEREGGDFKFRDHNAAVGVEHEIGLTQEAPRYVVQDRQQVLYEVMESVGRRLMGAER